MGDPGYNNIIILWTYASRHSDHLNHHKNYLYLHDIVMVVVTDSARHAWLQH